MSESEHPEDKEREIETKKKEIIQMDLLSPGTERRAARRAEWRKKRKRKVMREERGRIKNTLMQKKERNIRQMDSQSSERRSARRAEMADKKKVKSYEREIVERGRLKHTLFRSATNLVCLGVAVSP